jgi:hypothetical protein
VGAASRRPAGDRRLGDHAGQRGPCRPAGDLKRQIGENVVGFARHDRVHERKLTHRLDAHGGFAVRARPSP